MGENNTVNKVGSNSKINRMKFQVNSWAELSIFEYMVKHDFLVKSKLVVELSFGSGFLTLWARLAFAKMK